MVNICNREESEKCRMTVTAFVCMGVAMVAVLIWLSVIHHKLSEMRNDIEVLDTRESSNHDVHVETLESHATSMNDMHSRIESVKREHANTKEQVDQTVNDVSEVKTRVGVLETLGDQIQNAFDRDGNGSFEDDVSEEHRHQALRNSLKHANQAHQEFHPDFQHFMTESLGKGGVSAMDAVDPNTANIHTFPFYDANGDAKKHNGHVVRLVNEHYPTTGEDDRTHWMYSSKLSGAIGTSSSQLRNTRVTATKATTEPTQIFKGDHHVYMTTASADSCLDDADHFTTYRKLVEQVLRVQGGSKQGDVQTAVKYMEGIGVEENVTDGTWKIKSNDIQTLMSSLRPMNHDEKEKFDALAKMCDTEYKLEAAAKADAKTHGEYVDGLMASMYTKMPRSSVHIHNQPMKLMKRPTMGTLRSVVATKTVAIPIEHTTPTSVLKNVFLDNARHIDVNKVASCVASRTLAAVMGNANIGIKHITKDGTMLFENPTGDSKNIPLKLTVNNHAVLVLNTKFEADFGDSSEADDTGSGESFDDGPYTMTLQTQHDVACNAEIHVGRVGAGLDDVIINGGTDTVSIQCTKPTRESMYTTVSVPKIGTGSLYIYIKTNNDFHIVNANLAVTT